MKKSLLIVIGFLTFIVCTTLTIQLSKAAPAVNEWSDYTTATAAAYCLAKHPYRTTYTGLYTPDGYEIAAAPGIVGAVRRNFVFNRTSTLTDQGNGQTCAQACGEFGKLYGASLTGKSLTQKVGTTTFASGIGDIAALAVKDNDFSLSTTVVAGIWSRSNTFQESDVAQADFCCCQAQ
jgi:putative flippase GtrA